MPSADRTKMSKKMKKLANKIAADLNRLELSILLDHLHEEHNRKINKPA